MLLPGRVPGREPRVCYSISNRKILGFKIPRLRLLLPLFAVWGVCLLVVVFERDLGSAVLFYTIFLLMLYVATGRFSYVVIGLALLAVGAVGAYKFLSHVQVRFQVWVDPFKDAQGQGYQIVQSLFSLADGGLVGVGIGNGMANNIPRRRVRLYLFGYRRGDGPFGRRRRAHPVYAFCRAWPHHGCPR